MDDGRSGLNNLVGKLRTGDVDDVDGAWRLAQRVEVPAQLQQSIFKTDFS